MADNPNPEESYIDPFDEVKRLVPVEKYIIDRTRVDELRRSGQLMVACCPWHEEKTASFQINPEKGTFICRGSCEVHGSVIDAVMHNEKIDEPLEAVRWLNEHYRLGLKLGQWKHAERAKLAKAKIKAAQEEMSDPKSEVAKRIRDILHKRGFTDETIQEFGLAPDKERGRILIPIQEKGGHAIAWSGRAMYDHWTCKECGKKTSAKQANIQAQDAHQASGAEGSWVRNEKARKAGMACSHCGAETLPGFLALQHPKYRDSGGGRKDEPTYIKGQNLYNLFRAKRELFRQKGSDRQPFLLVEGFPDVWACHQSGYPGAVAYNGNQLTDTQAMHLVKEARAAERWIGLIFDNDATGRMKADQNIRTIMAAADLLDSMAEDKLREEEKDLDWRTRRERQEQRASIPRKGIDLRVLHGIDTLSYTDSGGEERICKDAGEVLEHFGEEQLAELLASNWWSADEYRIRRILTGDFDQAQQMDLVRDILREARHTIMLDSLVPLLAESWGISDQGVVRQFMRDSANPSASLADNMSLMADIDGMHEKAELFLADTEVLTTDYQELNDKYPGEGFRRKTLHLIMGRSGTGKTTFVVNMLYQFIRRHQAPVAFFSLEMPQEQLFMLFVQIHLGIKGPEMEKMIREKDPKLEEVKRVLRPYLTVVDNVPDESGEMLPMTPNRVLEIVHNINLTRGGRPIRAIAIDHLGIMEPDRTEGKQALESAAMGWGAVVKRLFTITKTLGITTFLLQQMNAQGSPPGHPVTLSSSRGSTEIIDYLDSALGIHRPELAPDASPDDKIANRGKYCVGVIKNRYGPLGMIDLMYNAPTRQVMESVDYGVPAEFLPASAAADLTDGDIEASPLIPLADPESKVAEEGPTGTELADGSILPEEGDGPSADPEWYLN